MPEWASKYRDATFDHQQLAEAAAEILGDLNVQTTDRRITELNAKSIRFYQSRKLLSPTIREGREAHFVWLHVLQVVTLRQLQADGHSLRMIGDLIESGDLPWSSPGALEAALKTSSEADYDRIPRRVVRNRLRAAPAEMQSVLSMSCPTPERIIAEELAPGVYVMIDPQKAQKEPSVVLNKLQRAMNPGSAARG